MCKFFCSDQVEVRGQFVGSLSLSFHHLGLGIEYLVSGLLASATY